MPFLGESQGTLSNLLGNPREISDFPTDLQKSSGRAASRLRVSRLLDAGSSLLPHFSAQPEQVLGAQSLLVPHSAALQVLSDAMGVGGCWEWWGPPLTWDCLQGLCRGKQRRGLRAEGRCGQGQAVRHRRSFQQPPEVKWAENSSGKMHFFVKSGEVRTSPRPQFTHYGTAGGLVEMEFYGKEYEKLGSLI